MPYDEDTLYEDDDEIFEDDSEIDENSPISAFEYKCNQCGSVFYSFVCFASHS